MADPPSNNMNVMVQLLTATIEKQGQMLQAIQDTNRNVERLATRIESIETVIARMTPSSGGRTPTPATQQTVQVAFDRDDVPIAGPSLSVESSAPVVVHKGAAAAAKANLTVPEAPTVVPDAQARTKFANDANTPNAGARLGHMKAPAASFSSKKGKQREQSPADAQLMSSSSVPAQNHNIPSTMQTKHHSSPAAPPMKTDVAPRALPDASDRLPTPTSMRTASKHPSDSDDDIVIISKDSQPKRKRKLNNARATPLPAITEHKKERCVSVSQARLTASPTIPRASLPAISAAAPSSAPPKVTPEAPATGTKRKPEDTTNPTLSKRPRLEPSKRLRVEVFIDLVDTETRAQMRSARPLSDMLVRDLGERRMNERDIPAVEAVPEFEQVFGSEELSELSDLTDLDSDDEEGDDEDIDQLGSDSDPDGDHADELKRRPKRKCATNRSYAVRFNGLDDDYVPPQPQDSDSDYNPSARSHHSSTPGPSRQSLSTRSHSTSQKSATVIGVKNLGLSSSGAGASPGHVVTSSPKSNHSARHLPEATTSRPRAGDSSRIALPANANSSQQRPPHPSSNTLASAPEASASRLLKSKDERHRSPSLRMRSDIKKDKAELELVPPAGIRRRLEGLGAHDVKLESRVRDVVVTRKFMSETYGGNVQALFPAIAPPKRASMGGHKHHLVYPTLKRNPEAPQMPGQPGLLCRALKTVPWEDAGIRKIKLVVGVGESMWGYMGDYTTEVTDPLSKEEWDSLPVKTKRTWAHDIAIANKYIPLRSRIVLREQWGREPTEEEVNDKAAVVKTHLSSFAKKERPRPTEDEIQQIMRAYSTGKQLIYIWRFKCVGYDEVFQREIVHKLSASHRKAVPPGRPAGGQPSPVKKRGRPSTDANIGSHAAAPGTSSVTKFGPPRGDKKLAKPARPTHTRAPLTGPTASIPSPPITPSPARELPEPQEKQPGWLLEDLRETFSRGKQISDASLAESLHQRRRGIRDMEAKGTIDHGEFVLASTDHASAPMNGR